MKPYVLVPLVMLLSGCVINTGTLASGNASGNKANVNAQANTKVDTSVNNQVSTNTNTNVTNTVGINTNVATNQPGSIVAPVNVDANLVAWLDLELVPGQNMWFNTTGKVEFKFAERPGMTKYKVVVKRIGEAPANGGLISNAAGGYKVALVGEPVVPAGAPTSFEQEGTLPIFSWTNPQAGVYAYQAVGYHKSGATITSGWRKFIVSSPTNNTNTGTNIGGTGTNNPIDGNAPAPPMGVVSSIGNVPGLTNAQNIDAASSGSKVYLANGGTPMLILATDASNVAVTNETVSEPVKAVAVATDGRYYLTASKIIKPSGAAVTLTGLTNASDLAVVGGNAYVTSTHDHVIQKVDLNTGSASLFAGSVGQPGIVDDRAAAARFNSPRGITYDAMTNALFVADSGNLRIRQVTLDGTVTVTTFTGSGTPGRRDGAGSVANFMAPFDITSNGVGTFFVADYSGQSIRMVSPTGTVTTIAGNGNRESRDGTGNAASFDNPASVAYGTLNGFPILFVGEAGMQAKIRLVQNW